MHEKIKESLKHNPNGRFVIVCGDGECRIYTVLAWRNRCFGSALEFVWSSDGEHAVRESTSRIKILVKHSRQLLWKRKVNLSEAVGRLAISMEAFGDAEGITNISCQIAREE
ncbi:coatomer subunit beta'-1-like isoform X1 [Elaeis guineensis]|uniref:coatomer subunit beta'-1-like isoform X1 n=1 Tax=Elaeis guineensis var. tenera TaxID=51953 RepID=UPI003C6D27E2